MKRKKPDPEMIDEENPEWTDEMFRTARPAREVFIELWGKEKAEAFLKANAAHIAAKRGRPRKAQPKRSTTLRLDADVLSAFRASGRGWQSRINAALREWIAKHPL